MKLLYLLRHAKSSWDDPSMEDFQRPLNKRGRRAAKLMAEHFRRHHIRPPVVLCSPSVRTRQTLEILSRQLDGAQITFDDRIYEATRQTLLSRVWELPAEAEEALLVGHNPGLERLALHLIDEAEDSPAMASLRDKYPTGSLTVLSAPVNDWHLLKAGVCRLDHFVRPGDLEEE